VVEAFRREGFTPDHSSKAYMFARALLHHHLILVTEASDAAELEAMFMRKASSVEEAVDLARSLVGQDSSILVLPHAIDCIPALPRREGP